jgi:hypothetical protein
MQALATTDDLKAYGITVTEENEKLAKRLLDSVSSAVRDAAGCPITLGEYTVDLPSEQSRKLDLPCKAVQDVSRVLVDGEPVDDWRLYGSALYREDFWGPVNGIPRTVTITFEAGWNPIPEDIVRLCCAYVSAGLIQQDDGGPGAHRGLSYERIDDAQTGYTQGDTELVDATELPEATKRGLKRRFGIRGVNIGVFR